MLALACPPFPSRRAPVPSRRSDRPGFFPPERAGAGEIRSAHPSRNSNKGGACRETHHADLEFLQHLNRRRRDRTTSPRHLLGLITKWRDGRERTAALSLSPSLSRQRGAHDLSN